MGLKDAAKVVRESFDGAYLTNLCGLLGRSDIGCSRRERAIHLLSSGGPSA